VTKNPHPLPDRGQDVRPDRPRPPKPLRMAHQHVATWDVAWWTHEDSSVQHEARKR
jgi:hypothetical protein